VVRGVSRCPDRRRRLKSFNFFSAVGGGWENSIFFWFSAAVAEIFLISRNFGIKKEKIITENVIIRN
jgi:hypothetical protein